MKFLSIRGSDTMNDQIIILLFLLIGTAATLFLYIWKAKKHMAVSYTHLDVYKRQQYGYANTLGILLLVLGILVMLFCNKLFRMDSVD